LGAWGKGVRQVHEIKIVWLTIHYAISGGDVNTIWDMQAKKKAPYQPLQPLVIIAKTTARPHRDHSMALRPQRLRLQTTELGYKEEVVIDFG